MTRLALTMSLFCFLLFLSLARKVAGPGLPINHPYPHPFAEALAFENAENTPGGRKFFELMRGIYRPDIVVDACLRFIIGHFYYRSIPPFMYVVWVLLPTLRNVELPVFVPHGNPLITLATEIDLSAEEVLAVQGSDEVVRKKIIGVLLATMARMWSSARNSWVPDYLKTGIPSYIRLIAEYPSDQWKTEEQVTDYKAGYEEAAYFLRFCQGYNSNIDFMAMLNARLMHGDYNDNLFEEILGVHVDWLFLEFLAHIRHMPH